MRWKIASEFWTELGDAAGDIPGEERTEPGTLWGSGVRLGRAREENIGLDKGICVERMEHSVSEDIWKDRLESRATKSV